MRAVFIDRRVEGEGVRCREGWETRPGHDAGSLTRDVYAARIPSGQRPRRSSDADALRCQRGDQQEQRARREESWKRMHREDLVQLP